MVVAWTSRCSGSFPRQGWGREPRCDGRARGSSPLDRCRARRPEASLSALLHVALHELLRVGLEDLVDLVEEIVELGLELLALLGRGRLGDDLGRLRLLLPGLRRICSRSAMATTPHCITRPAASAALRASHILLAGNRRDQQSPAAGPASARGAADRCPGRTPANPSWRPRSTARSAAGSGPGSRPGAARRLAHGGLHVGGSNRRARPARAARHLSGRRSLHCRSSALSRASSGCRP